MSEYRRQFRLQVLTPLGQVCACDAVSVVFPASDGLAGVLGGHAPLVAMLGAGPLSIEMVGGERREFYLAGGFAHVRYDTATILAEQCVPAETLDPEAVRAEMEEARSLPADSPPAAERRREVLAAARVKLRMARARAERAT